MKESKDHLWIQSFNKFNMLNYLFTVYKKKEIPQPVHGSYDFWNE